MSNNKNQNRTAAAAKLAESKIVKVITTGVMAGIGTGVGALVGAFTPVDSGVAMGVGAAGLAGSYLVSSVRQMRQVSSPPTETTSGASNGSLVEELKSQGGVKNKMAAAAVKAVGEERIIEKAFGGIEEAPKAAVALLRQSGHKVNTVEQYGMTLQSVATQRGQVAMVLGVKLGEDTVETSESIDRARQVLESAREETGEDIGCIVVLLDAKIPAVHRDGALAVCTPQQVCKALKGMPITKKPIKVRR